MGGNRIKRDMNVGDLVTRYLYNNTAADFVSTGIVVEKLSRHVVTVYWYKVDVPIYALGISRTIGCSRTVGKSDEAVLNLEMFSRAP